MNRSFTISCIESENVFLFLKHKTGNVSFINIKQLRGEVKNLLNLNIPRMIHDSSFLGLLPYFNSFIHTTGEDSV
jgi:Na+-driven multidrug efflux pump